MLNVLDFEITEVKIEDIKTRLGKKNWLHHYPFDFFRPAVWTLIKSIALEIVKSKSD